MSSGKIGLYSNLKKNVGGKTNLGLSPNTLLKQDTGAGGAFANANSVDFSGSTDYMSIPEVAALVPTASISVFTWVKFNTLSVADTLIANRNAGTHTRWAMLINPSISNDLQVFLSSDGTEAAGKFKQYNFNLTFFVNTWYHVGFTYTGDTLTLYKDGSVVTPDIDNDVVMTALPAGNGDDLLVGAMQSGGIVNHGDLKIDEPTIWNKQLSASEVSELYNSATVFDYSTHSAAANLVGWWRMGDGDSAPTITDQQGNSNGTLVNSPTVDTDVP